MTQTTSPALDIALAYYHAWTSHDLDKAMSYVADEIACRKSSPPPSPAVQATPASVGQPPVAPARSSPARPQLGRLSAPGRPAGIAARPG